MADRYAVASGNWNSTSTWSATSGGASGASVPTSSDDVYLNSNYVVTLTTNADCANFYHTNGVIDVSSYNFNVHLNFNSTGSTARTLNFGSGIITITGTNDNSFGDKFSFNLTGSNLTLTAGSSLLVLNVDGYDALTHEFNTLGKTFNDVRINMAPRWNYGLTLAITGSPTFRLLDIRSANSKAHTVNFDIGAEIKFEKFIALGYSTSRRLTFDLSGATGDINDYAWITPNSPNSTCYGQFLRMGNVGDIYANSGDWLYAGGTVPAYIGSNSIYGGPSRDGWDLSDPPKISTLVDPLTATPSSNTNWTVTGTVTQVTTGHDGGGYRLDSGGKMVSTDTYDIVDSWLLAESLVPLYKDLYVNVDALSDVSNSGVAISYMHTSDLEDGSYSSSADYVYMSAEYNDFLAGDYKYNRIKLNSANNNIVVGVSSDGSSWSSLGSYLVDQDVVDYYRSVRIDISTINADGSTIGSINPSLASAPSVTTSDPTSVSYTTATVNGNVTSAGTASVTERGFVYATTANPTTADTNAIVSGTTGAYSKSLTGLTNGTTYHVRAYAINSVGTAYGDDVSFTMLTYAAPSITTGSATSLTNVSATLGGNVTNDNGKTITERGVCWSTSANPTTSSSKQTSSGTAGSYTVSATSLTANTTYHYRAYAINSMGTSYGADNTFTTYGPPTVTTDSTGSVSYTSASVSGNVTADNGASITQRGIAYATTVNPTTSNSTKIVAGTTGSFTGSLTSLTDNTLYYVRSYAINTYGTSYGSQLSFTTTQITAPSVSSSTATDIGPYSAKVYGSIDNYNGDTPTEKGFVYSLTANPTTSDNKLVTSGGDSFNNTISSLTDGTQYHWRAYATNSRGTGYSSDRTFTTLTVTVPTVTTNDVTSVTLSTAVAGGNATSANNGTITDKGVVYNTTGAPTTADSKTSMGSGTGAFSGTVPSLSSHATYYLRAYATNEKGSGYGAEKTFTTPAIVPTVYTGTADSITESSVSIDGSQVTSDPDNVSATWGIVYSTTTNPDTSDNIGTTSDAKVNFSSSLTGLTSYTVYYYKAYVDYGEGIAYGSQQTFTTSAQTPTVATGSVAGIQLHGATIQSNAITNPDGYPVQEYGVVYGLDPNPDISNQHETASSSPSNYSVILSALSADTTYHVRAYIKVDSSYSYGDDISFTTLPLPFEMVTGRTQKLTTTQVLIANSGVLNNPSSQAIIEYGIVYATTTAPTTASNKVAGDGTSLNYDTLIQGLQPNTTYYYRSYASSETDTYYGPEIFFTTKAPTVIKPTMSRYIHLKVELLDKDEKTIAEKKMKLDSGQITVSTSHIRRKATFSLLETLPSDWQDKRWRLSYGYSVTPREAPKYVQQGVFLPINPSEEEANDGYITQYQGVDKYQLFDDYIPETATTFISGTTVRSAITTIAGWVNETSRLNLGDSLGTMQSDYRFEEGTSAASMLDTITSAFSDEWFYDRQGILVARQLTNPQERPIKYVMDDTKEPIYISASSSIDTSNYYNKCILVGGTQDDDVYRSVQQNSGAILKAGGRVITRRFTIDAPTSQAMVNGRCAYYLSNGVLLPRQLQLTSLVLADLEIGDIITKDGVRYEVREFDIPLGLDSQSITAGEIVIEGVVS